MRIYFSFIFLRLLTIFLSLHFFILSGSFCLELLMHSSIARNEKLFFHFLNLSLLRSDLFLPLSFLLATIYTAQNLKQNNEWSALLASGISKLRLSLPFATLALLLTLFSYWNIEWGIPKTLSWMNHYKAALRSLPFQVQSIPNQGRIIYQQEDNHIFDLYWITSEKEIWHCKEVALENNSFLGHFVDHLRKNPLGRFEKIDSFAEYKFPFSFEKHLETHILSDESSLSEILFTFQNSPLLAASDQAKLLTLLLYKLIYPWFPFLFLTGIFAFSSKVTSSYTAFLIGIFFYLLFYSLMKTSIVLGENYKLSPWISLFLFPFVLQLFFLRNLCKN